MSRYDVIDDCRQSRTPFCLESQGKAEPCNKDDYLQSNKENINVSFSADEMSTQTTTSIVSTSYLIPSELSSGVDGVSKQNAFSPLEAVFGTKHHPSCTSGKCVPNCEKMELISKLMVEVLCLLHLQSWLR
uniref:Ovule protein n=1 Tax=Heterorhabditis bacteriophora TaxID=37862 RepID=A0A1I7WQR6_HETBA